MTEDIDDGGPAFPEHSFLKVGDIAQGQAKPGMSLRDYFAATALQGLLQHVKHQPRDMVEMGKLAANQWAHDSYMIADALIAARKADKP